MNQSFQFMRNERNEQIFNQLVNHLTVMLNQNNVFWDFDNLFPPPGVMWETAVNVGVKVKLTFFGCSGLSRSAFDL